MYSNGKSSYSTDIHEPDKGHQKGSVEMPERQNVHQQRGRPSQLTSPRGGGGRGPD